jgi:hypothetical protein
MSDEIRQAAELVLSKATIANKYDNAAQKVARAYLAENDDTAIDEAWLRAVGFEKPPSGGLRIKSPHWGSPRHHCRYTQIYADKDGWWVNGLGCPTPKTRGDVRRLCGALGIELQEAAR